MKHIRWVGFLILGSLLPGAALGQWNIVGSNLLGAYSTQNGGAFASHDGIVYVGYHELFKSSDSGRSWIATKLNTEGNTIFDICFFDSLSGIVAVENRGVFLTRDGGSSWALILQQLDCIGVAFVRDSNEVIACDRQDGGTIHYTSDGGQSWKGTQIESNGGGVYQVLTRPNGASYALSRSISPGRESHISESTDFGLTWLKHQGGVDLDSYSFTLDSCDVNRIYLVNEAYNEAKDGFSKIFRSADRGDSFDTAIRRPANFFSASCASTLRAVYIGSSSSEGVFRTTDRGDTWKSIGGPAMHQDSRLLTAIDDNIVFAADEQGNIWRTLNSGGAPIDSHSIGLTIPLSISSERIINDTPGVTVNLPIYLKSNQMIPSFNMIVHYPANPLKYLRTVLPSGGIVDISGEQWDGRAKIHFDAKDLAPRKDSLIGYCVFKWLPSEYVCANISFDSLETSASSSPCTENILLDAAATEGLIGSYKSCGFSSVTEESGPGYEMMFRLNPSSDFGLLTSCDYSGALAIDFVTELGVVLESEAINMSAGLPITLDLRSLPQGAYFIKVSCEKFSKVIPFIHSK